MKLAPFEDRPDDQFCLRIAWRISRMHDRKLNGCQQSLLFTPQLTQQKRSLYLQGAVRLILCMLNCLTVFTRIRAGTYEIRAALIWKLDATENCISYDIIFHIKLTESMSFDFDIRAAALKWGWCSLTFFSQLLCCAYLREALNQGWCLCKYNGFFLFFRWEEGEMSASKSHLDPRQ